MKIVRPLIALKMGSKYDIWDWVSKKWQLGFTLTNNGLNPTFSGTSSTITLIGTKQQYLNNNWIRTERK